VRSDRGGVRILDVLDRVYDLELPWEPWLESIAEVLQRITGADKGLAAVRWRVDAQHQLTGQPWFFGVPDGYANEFEEVVRITRSVVPIALDVPVGGLTETFEVDHPFRIRAAELAAPHGIRDIQKLTVCDSIANILSLSPLFSYQFQTAAPDRRRLQHICDHLASCLRLRASLETRGAWRIEAILDGSGKVHHAEGGAPNGLKLLRRAVLDRERIRSQTTRGVERDALDLWQGMVDGRWTLLDRFEGDGEGRRFILAIKNDHELPTPRSLTMREEMVAQLVGRGFSNKEIGSSLGLSTETTAFHVKNILRKFSFESRADIIRWMNEENIEFALDIDDVIVGVLAEPKPSTDDSFPTSLSPSEWDVFARVKRGESNRTIAEARGTSVRTVANQIQSVLRKTGCASRYELMASASASTSRSLPE
jgi:DNA-binding NarL/FixJ family response regulator